MTKWERELSVVLIDAVLIDFAEQHDINFVELIGLVELWKMGRRGG